MLIWDLFPILIDTGTDLANSTSYGIFVEMIVAELDAVEKLICFGPAARGFPSS